ncbi:MAG: hypothetical protein KDD62_08905 [Bdellovibrionales bacterium]|nr:hypothetical protein [Bdellovibrionales bacterium]
MKPLRIANFDHSSAAGYTPLQDVLEFDYQSCALMECSRKLHEGEVDVALIPAAEYAAHGNYTSLGFGLGCHLESRFLMLYAEQPLQRLHTIYTYQGGGTGLLLLRLLLSERWRINPRIIRCQESKHREDLAENEGLLVLHDSPEECEQGAWPIAEDLVSVWHEWTGLPFIFLLWAARPESLSSEQCRQLHDRLYHCHRQRSNEAEQRYGVYNLPAEYRGDYRPDLFYHYYLEQDMIEGLNLFFSLCAKKGLIPEAEYRTTSVALSDVKKPALLKEKPIDEILEGAVSGKRLGIEQGIRLAQEASIGDLGMASEIIRRRMFSDTTLSFMYEVKESELGEVSSIQDLAEEAVEAGCHSIFIVPDKSPKRVPPIEFYEERLYGIRSCHGIPLEGIGIPRMLQIAKQSKLPIEQVVQRLFTAGLDVVPGWGGEMLIDERRRVPEVKTFSSAEWLDCVQSLHVLGLKSAAAMRLHRDDSWEDRLVHLNKVRSQQDLTGGFWFFSNIPPEVKHKAMGVEDQMRAVMISRLFLDNVPSIQEVRVASKALPRALSLCAGANAIRIRVSGARGRSVRDIVRMLKAVARYEFVFRADPIEDSIAPHVH